MVEPGNKVKIKPIDWYNSKKDENGNINYLTGHFTPNMSLYCGQTVTIKKTVDSLGFLIVEDNGVHTWSRFMFDA